jgi:hypothetical protein
MNAPLRRIALQRPAANDAVGVFEQIRILQHFIGPAQLRVMADGCGGEEKEFFFGKLLELANTARTMPQVYAQDGLGDSALAYLHYFTGSCDWYITERDTTDEQIQAFGLANLGYGGELGYISIAELIEAGAELDLHWTPKPLRDCRKD